MTKENLKIIFSSFIFKGVKQSVAEEIIATEDFRCESFDAGETVSSPADGSKGVGFILSGECKVKKKHKSGDFTTLNILKKGSSFGILSVFSSASENPTYIIATKRTSVAFLSDECVIRLAKRFPTIALNIINFMAERISFLNDKIETFSGSSVEEKIFAYIKQIYKTEGKTEFPFNKARAADAISAGRASVYRALDALVKQNIIFYDGKILKITSPEDFERN